MVLRLTLPRWPPLAPEFVVARGEGARALARLLLADPARLAGLRGVVSFGELLPSLARAAATERTPEPPHVLAVTGDDLPWLDGVEYFGRDGAASWLLVPTTRTGPLPTSWLERRYRAALPSLDWPCLLLDDALLPVGRAAAFDRDRLSRWCSDG